MPYLVAAFSGFINIGSIAIVPDCPIEVLLCSAAVARKDVPRSGLLSQVSRGHSNNPIEVLPCSAAFSCKDVPSSGLLFITT